MKFCQFVYKDKPERVRAGYVVKDQHVVDINMVDGGFPSTMLAILKNGDVDLVKKLSTCDCPPPMVALSSVTLKAPITGMDKVLCVGLNYLDHSKERNLTPPASPMIFSKFPSCVIGPNDAVRIKTEVAKSVDWEVELCVVIGKKASSVKAAQAYDHVFGLTIAQDISDRKWEKQNEGQLLLGKAMDTFCPLGPWIVTLDEIGDPDELEIRCAVNGKEKQYSFTNQFIHKIPAIIEKISSVITLLPGDIILTGTPAGVGAYRQPPQFLRPGDKIVSEIQKIGVLTTRIENFDKVYKTK